MDSPVYCFAQRIGFLIRAVRTVFSYITAILFAVLFASFVLQIFMRFILNNPLSWSEELSVISYIWIVFLACAFILHDDQHVIFTLIVEVLPEKLQHFCRLISSLIFGGILIAISTGVFDYIAFMKIETTSALAWRKDYIYSVFAVFLAVVSFRCLYAAVLSLIGIFNNDTYHCLMKAFGDKQEEEENV